MFPILVCMLVFLVGFGLGLSTGGLIVSRQFARLLRAFGLQ